MFLFNGNGFASPKSGESLTRSFAKAASWRVLGSFDTFVLGFIFTGSAKAAGSIAATEVVSKTVLYILHEQGWARVPWGRRKDTPPPTPAEKEAPSDPTPAPD